MKILANRKGKSVASPLKPESGGRKVLLQEGTDSTFTATARTCISWSAWTGMPPQCGTFAGLPQAATWGAARVEEAREAAAAAEGSAAAAAEEEEAR